MPAEQDKIATLRQAAAAKREAAAARAEAGIRKLTKAGQPVTFRAVAAAGGVQWTSSAATPACEPASNGSAAANPDPPETRRPASRAPPAHPASSPP